jgi:glycosyltransferase involved in cell wall biosynthesis
VQFDPLETFETFQKSSNKLRITSHETLTLPAAANIDVTTIKPSSIAEFIPLLRGFVAAYAALRLLFSSDPKGVLICNGGSSVGRLAAFFNQFLSSVKHRRRIVMWECFAQNNRGIKGWMNRVMLCGCTYVVVYSRKLIDVQAQLHNVSCEKFVFVPYKANHSKSDPIRLNIGNYIFAGGNSSRDYETLFKAVTDTDIPVIVSTSLKMKNLGIAIPENIILLQAQEPYFARLMAGSKFVVLPVRPNIVFGQAVASVSNAMWHGKPVIAADDAACQDYIADGITGFVVPAGDHESLRQKIQLLWKSRDLERMSETCHATIARERTHAIFWQRLIGLAIKASESAATS